ncbi:Hydrogenase isoenzymes formation protein HypC [Vibrio aerogenes CECT 7868]|uniref:Hydrogenase isoenzymes formation protein HypC n=1 Tax=Vibrio aerogenes CECT 7868 TaxID=1216006 RepID=A0A1M5YN40_9VIBR|nr:HypC/HybG/HupF family hydrogenase formation chaperone [Vibrio aerogenes]SHI13360.1 Hydrogenase isoenzymes formation protein HypC [Vibrio aerogenes CECT 7868]
MCLCIPSCVIEVRPDTQTALVETMGVVKEVSTHLIAEPVHVGEHLLIHVGFAISKIDQEEARKSLETYQKLMDEIDPEQAWIG